MTIDLTAQKLEPLIGVKPTATAKKNLPFRENSAPVTAEDLQHYATWYLQKQFPSEKKLQQKLQQYAMRHKPKSQTMAEIDPLIMALLENLKQQNIINDERLARALTEQWLRRGIPFPKIAMKLTQKFFDRNVIAQVLAHGRAQPEILTEIEMAEQFARRKKLGIFRLDKNFSDHADDVISLKSNQKQKDLNKMARAGFSYQSAKKFI